MGHVVVRSDAYCGPDDEDVFFIYSSVVDGPITGCAHAAGIKKFLVEEGYDSWTDDVNFQEVIESRHVGAPAYRWNGEHGFMYLAQEDGYYILPRDLWRTKVDEAGEPMPPRPDLDPDGPAVTLNEDGSATVNLAAMPTSCSKCMKPIEPGTAVDAYIAFDEPICTTSEHGLPPIEGVWCEYHEGCVPEGAKRREVA